jgi:hypothetical protein
MEPSQADRFESWAIIELFGHTQIAGKVSEATIGGCSFLRVDVPEIDGKPAITKFYGQGAIYSMTPVSEELARAAVKSFQHRPVNVYITPARLADPGYRPAGTPEDGDDDWCPICDRPAETCSCV